MNPMLFGGGNTPDDDENYGKTWYMITLVVIGLIVVVGFLVGFLSILHKIES